jgi:hypothetical protein
LLQIAANPYAAILGRPETAASRLNLAQGVNSLGTTLAPIAGGLLLYKVFATGGELTIDSIKVPYLIYASWFIILAAVVWRSHLPRFSSQVTTERGMGALKFPHLRFGMVAVFMYVGAEVAIGSYLVNFIQDKKIMGLPELALTATTVRIPVQGGHSESVNIAFEQDFDLGELRTLLSGSPGIVVQDDPSMNLYPMPRTAHNRDEVFVGRIRRDFSQPNSLNCWIVADNLRKGAATNAVQIAELFGHR